MTVQAPSPLTDESPPVPGPADRRDSGGDPPAPAGEEAPRAEPFLATVDGRLDADLPDAVSELFGAPDGDEPPHPFDPPEAAETESRAFEPAADGGDPAPEVPDFLAEFEDALVEGLSDDGAASSGEPDAGAGGIASAAPADEPVLSAPAGAAAAMPLPAPEGARPIAALAFACDGETERALRQGLSQFEKPGPRYEDPQIWAGGLPAAIAALAGGYGAALVIVDIDGMPYPAGAIHELAEVCDVGTAVVAIGSDATARSSRELLLAGVSDYLVKPVSPAAIGEAASRAAATRPAGPVNGSVVGFTGTGGSGVTTLVAATALQTANRGRYVSVLDLNRTFPSAAVLLDVEPAAGLDQILEMAVAAAPDPQMLDGMRVDRSERISVYAYRWSPTPHPAPSLRALKWLLGELRHRSQLVLVDGLDDPELRFALLELVDLRVVVGEPTGRDILPAARIVGLLGDRPPTLLVRNHTREFKRGMGTGLFRQPGTETALDIEIPFDAGLPTIADRGWPAGRLPRRLRKPLAGLADRILTDTGAGLPLPAAEGA